MGRVLCIGVLALGMAGCLENGTVNTIAQLNDVVHKYDDTVTLRVYGVLSASVYETVRLGIGQDVNYDITLTKGNAQVNEGAEVPITPPADD